MARRSRTFTIPDGDTVSNVFEELDDVAGLVIEQDAFVTMDITAVGTTFPGRRLRAVVRL